MGHLQVTQHVQTPPRFSPDIELTTIYMCVCVCVCVCVCELGNSVGIAADYGLYGPGSNPGESENFPPSRPGLGPPSLLYNGYRVFPGGKVRPGCAADHSPPSSAALMEE